MPRIVTFLCPDCHGEFDWFFCKSDDEAPNHCPKCGNYMGSDPQVVPGHFSLGTGKGKAVDSTYRQMEESSAVRAEALGDPSLKITDMNDGLRPGDVAGKKPVNAVTQFADQSEHQYFQQEQVSTVITQSKMGKERTTGERALRAIQGGLMSNAPQVAPQAIKGFGAGFGGAGT
jgi:hypothetical protein